MKERNSYVYILASSINGTLYVGVTSDISRRIWEHKNKTVKGFTEQYQVDKLVYYSIFEDVNEAINFEKQLKKWERKWKIRIIEEVNPQWQDLYEEMSK